MAEVVVRSRRRHKPGTHAAEWRKRVACCGVGASQQADLAELADWVEGLRGAAQAARAQGNITLAEALDITRFEVYEGYLDAELDLQQNQAAARHSA